MANTLANLARVRSVTTGTGNLAFGAAVTGALTFTQAGVSDGATVTYAIEDFDTNNLVSNREIGRGTFSGSTLTRDSVYASTNAGSKINCSGRQHVFITAAKEDFDSFLTSASASALYLTQAAAAAAYQPLDADLSTWAGITPSANAQSLVAAANYAAMRALLDLEAGTDFYSIAAADAAFLSQAEGDAAYQPLDADLTAIAALSGTNTIYYRSAANTWSAVTVSATLGFSGGTLGSALASSYQPLDSDLTTLAANITAFGHSLVDDADATAGRSTLGLVIGTNVQAYDADLTTLGAGGSGARDFLGLGTGDSPQLTAINLGHASDTTLTRVSAGLMAVEGNTVAMLNTANVFTQNQTIAKAGANMNVGASSGDGTHYVSAVAGSAATIRWSNYVTPTSVQDRWLFGKSNAAESGSDAGSGFDCYYYTDAGAFKGVAFQASRVDGSFNWRGGQYSNGVTGGSKGAGTINFATLYEGGTSLAAKYGALASANVWTAAQTVRIDNATTNAVTQAARLSHTTTGTPANGIGVGLEFEAETTAGNNEVGATIEAVATDVTSTSEDFDLVFKTMAAGAAAAERMRIKSTGTVLHGTAALATNATDGFVYVPSCAGTPTGVPTAHTGMAAIVVDSTNNKLYFYSGGAWRDAGP